MAKSKQKPAPPTSSAAANIEDKIAEVGSGVARVARDYRVPILVGIVVVVAVIGLFGIMGFYRDQQTEAQNVRLFELLEGSDAEIRAGYEKLLGDVQGTSFEPFAVMKIANWLCGQPDAADRTTALALVRDARSRHESDSLLEVMGQQLEAAAADDQGFTVPAPPVVKPPLEVIPQMPGTPAPGTPAPGTPAPGTPAPAIPDGNGETPPEADPVPEGASPPGPPPVGDEPPPAGNDGDGAGNGDDGGDGQR